MADHPSLVIRGGTVADGFGGEVFEADISISDGRITEVGKVAAKGAEEIDARGKLVTPGFVDLHTHYDGQVTWANDISPSSQNGVSTAIMGNCGVGFAPVQVEGRRRGYPGAGAERRFALGLGKLPGLHGLAVAASVRHGYRRATA